MATAKTSMAEPESSADQAERLGLQPCPFCGGPGCVETDLDEDSTDGIYNLTGYVRCHECGARSPRVDYLVDAGEEDLADLERRVAKAWHIRSNEEFEVARKELRYW